VKETFLKLGELEKREMFPGATARFLHTERLTIAYWNFEPGVPIPEHAHVHEQVFNVIEGAFDLTVGGETKRMEAGSAAAIPSNVRHSGRSVSACTIIDVFSPVREDLK
jgi:quercetin dioxygenase-like cupin family protein